MANRIDSGRTIGEILASINTDRMDARKLATVQEEYETLYAARRAARNTYTSNPTHANLLKVAELYEGIN